jgi:ribosome-associated protein
MGMKQKIYESEDLVKVMLSAMEEKKAKDITILDLQDIDHAITNYFIICHGTSKPQLEAIAEGLTEGSLEAFGVKPWHKEGFENAEWILLDYVDVVVHIFQDETRKFYNLEGLWADAEIKAYNDKKLKK